MLKLQQVACGYVSSEAEEPVESLFPDERKNPRIVALLDLLDECQGKVIIWSRFIRDIKTIAALLEERSPGRVVTYFGETKKEDRRAARERFEGKRALRDADDKVVGYEPIPVEEQADYFIGQQQSGGIGLTLVAAHHVIYYSNTFSLEDRAQSEDRAHRIGLNHNVTYSDLQCPGTVDVKVVQSLRDKKELADIITRDNLREWL
jgi:SNF2 family DNA or RNA helicase